MTLSRLHSLTIDDNDNDDNGPTSVMVTADLLDELDDFLQWVKDPSDDGGKHLPVCRSDVGDANSPLGVSKNTLRAAELLEEITLLRDMDIADDSFFGSKLPAATTTTTTMTLAPSRPHLRGANATDHSAPHTSPMSNTSSAAVTPISESEVPPQAGVAKKKRDQNRSRKRQREELLQLRVVAKELEAQLKELLHPDDSSSSEDSTTSSPSSPDELAAFSSSLASQRHSFLHKALFWKRAASAAKEQAEFSQMENARLRALIEENELVCDGAREIWHKHPATKLAYGDAIDTAALHSTPIRDFTPFETLRVGLDALLQRQRAVWGECDFQNNVVMERKPESRLRVDGDSAFIELTRASVLPFSPEEVNRSLWHIVERGLVTSSMGELKIRKAVENMFFLTLSDSIRLSEEQDLTVKAWIVAKQVVEGDQIVSVWRSIAEIQSDVVPAFELSESGWSAVQSLSIAGRPGSLKQAPSVLQSCARLSPERNGVALSRDEFSADSVIARVITQFHQNRLSLIQVVENVLLDESLAGRKVGVMKKEEEKAFTVSL